jgi:hypothetical protein
MVGEGGVIEGSKWWNGGCESATHGRATRYLCKKASVVLVGEHP